MKPTIANLLTEDRQPLTNISTNAPLQYSLPNIKPSLKHHSDVKITLPPARELLSRAGTKRKSDDAQLDEHFDEEDDHSVKFPGSIEPEVDASVWHAHAASIPIADNCDEVRQKIRQFLEWSQATVKQFCQRIQVSSKSYYSFMSAEGPNKGVGNHTYAHAYAYFHDLEKTNPSVFNKDSISNLDASSSGIPKSNKKQRIEGGRPDKPERDGSSLGSNNSYGHVAPPTTASSSTTSVDKLDAKPSRMTRHETSIVAQHPEIILPGEMEDKVRIYDTCDEIRRKINNHLRKPGVTQAGFIRELLLQYHLPTRPTKLQGNQIATFRNKKGPLAGNSSIVYYAAYVFFEKERLALGLAKTTHRLEMERQWPNGVDTERHTGWTYCLKGERPVEDRWGKIHYQKR